MDRETLVNVARTSLRTKVHTELADLLTEVRYRRNQTVVGGAKELNFISFLHIPINADYFYSFFSYL